MNRTIHRRSLLQGAGIALGLPLLEAMSNPISAADSTYQPVSKTLRTTPRLICCYIPNGVNIKQWAPKENGASYTLSPTLEVLKEHRDDFTVLTGLGHPACKGGHSGADTWLTGADLGRVPGAEYTNSESIDQVIAKAHEKETRFASLQLSDMSGTGGAGHSHTLSFNRNGTPMPAENSPRRLFERLFVSDSAEGRETLLKTYADKKSILDSVLQDAKRLDRMLGRQDQQKVEEYMESVRQTEARVLRLESWIDVPKPEINATGLQLDSKPIDAHDRPAWIDVMLELCYLTFVTDATRVITFEWSREAGGFGGGGENHHELSHHGGDDGMLNRLAQIDRFHLSKLNRFLTFLKSTQDGQQRMLDNTMVLFGSGMNSGEGGDHSPKNLPLLVAGGSKLGLRHGQHLAFDVDQHPPLANVHLTLAQKMGVETETFSDASGTLTGLTQVS